LNLEFPEVTIERELFERRGASAKRTGIREL
jgi:hypothetical protein